MNRIISRIGITPVGSSKYRLNRLRFHLLAYVISRKAKLNGQSSSFYIRCDDTDYSKTNISYLDEYIKVLNNLGVRADKYPQDIDEDGFPLFQSRRTSIYKVFLAKLLDSGLAFKDNSGAIFFDTKKFADIFQNIIIDNSLYANDLCLGKLKLDIRSSTGNKMELVPFPIVRSNGQFLFNFCSPVDDHIMGITHVIRDRDKLDLLAKQEMIRVSLDLREINYLHAPILVDGERKRLIEHIEIGEATYQNLLEKGYMPQSIVSYLLASFYGPPETFYPSIDDFATKLDVAKIHRANVTFSIPVLKQHNKKELQISTRYKYLSDFKNFLSMKDKILFDKINKNSNLEDFIFEMKRNFEESKKIIKCLTNEEYEEIGINQKEAIIRILTSGLLKPESVQQNPYYELYVIKGKENAQKLLLSFPEYCKSLIYILTGKVTDLSIRDIITFLEATNQIESRFEKARREFL